MSQLLYLVVILTIVTLYFKSILSKSDDDLNSISNPNGVKIILGINCLGLISFILPWVNLPIIGGVNGIELLSDSFATRVNETTLFAIIFLSILFSINIIGSLIQLKSNIAKRSLTKNIEIISGVLFCYIGFVTITEFKEYWSAPDDNFIGNALAMTTSIGWGLYLIIFLGLAQIVSVFAIKSK